MNILTKGKLNFLCVVFNLFSCSYVHRHTNDCGRGDEDIKEKEQQQQLS